MNRRAVPALLALVVVALVVVALASCGGEGEPPAPAGPEDAGALLDRAATQLARGTPEGFAEATSLYRGALSLRPGLGEARYGLAQAEIGAGRPWAGQWHLTRLLHDTPAHAGALRTLGLRAYARGAHEDAVLYLEKLGRVRSLDGEETVALAVASNRTNRFAAAETLFTRALERLPDRPPPERAFLHESRGSSRRKQGRLEDAAADFRRAVELEPSRLSARSRLVTVLLDLNLLEEAGDVLAAIPPDRRPPPDSPAGATPTPTARDVADLLFLRARLRTLHSESRQVLALAEADLERALDGSPDHIDALHLLAQIRRRRGDLAGAREAAERHREAVRARGSAGRVLAMKDLVQGAIAEEEGDLDRALAAYRKGLAEDPGNLHLHCAIAPLLQAMNRRTEARAHFTKLREAMGGGVPGPLFLQAGRELRRRGLPRAAARQFELAAKRLPGSEEAIYFHALALSEAGDWDAALAAAAPLEAPPAPPGAERAAPPERGDLPADPLREPAPPDRRSR